MANTCRICKKKLIVPSWTTCQDCSSIPKEKTQRRENPYMKKYRDDQETLGELARKHPAGKSRKT